MTVAVASPLNRIYQGRIVHSRFWVYIGLMVGATLLAIFGGNGYDEDSYLFRLLSLQGVLWCGAGAVAGVVASLFLGGRAASGLNSPSIMNTTPWLDGLTLMLVLMAIFTLLEPHSSLISYEDQSNMVSGKIVMTMNMLFLFSAVCYITYLFAPESFIGKMATFTAWAGVYAGGSSLLLRWYESYLFLDGDIGHAPVSNLYEVFILMFCITCSIYLSFERRYQAKAMGAFVMVIIAAGVFFGIWLDSIGQADIKPLVPALQSYWMKIHVPLNFIGYGSFAVACAAGMLFLGRETYENKNNSKGFAFSIVVIPSILIAISFKALITYQACLNVVTNQSVAAMSVREVLKLASSVLPSWWISPWTTVVMTVVILVALVLLTSGFIERKGNSFLNTFPTLEVLDNFAYKAVAVGFPAFTLATILGAAWAAEAWGGYWSWDPKETWALIVWLFYGAYLHVRISHGWSGKTLAWWAVAGFVVTLFCFVGVNMYLSGLHSYGRLA